jgi:hypothetical protein
MRLVMIVLTLVVATPVLANRLPTGQLVVRRVQQQRGSGATGFGADGVPPERWQTVRTSCERLDLSGDDDHVTATLPGLTLVLDRDRKGAWHVTQAHVVHQRPALVLPLTCHDPFTFSGDGNGLSTSAGPVHPDMASCRATPFEATRRCRGDQCEYDDPTAAPFILPTCDAEAARVAPLVRTLRAASHQDARRTLRRLEHVAGRGGTLWQHEPRAGACVPVRVMPLGGARVRLTMRFREALGGERFTRTRELELEPLHQTARLDSWVETSAGGMSGGGAQDQLGLYLGRDLVLLGVDWLYFTRKACRTAHP